MSTDEEELKNLVDRLCARLNVPDQMALYATPEFEAAYALQHSRNGRLSEASLTGKALDAMAIVTQKGIDTNAHCVEPQFEFIKYDADEKKNVCTAIGIQIATPDGNTKFVQYAERDPTVPLDEQFKGLGLPGDFTRGCPLTLRKVDVVEDLRHDTVKISLTAESTVEAGGHNDPFPEGPDLDKLVGDTAFKKGWASWRIIKKYGTYAGKFGDTDGDPKALVGTVTKDVNEIKVFAPEEKPIEEHQVACVCNDRKGEKISIKFKLSDVLEQFGLPEGAPADLVKTKVAGQRFLARLQGSIFHPKDPKDFGDDGAVFWQAWVDLQKNGYLVGYGEKNPKPVRLSLVDKFQLLSDGTRVPQHSVRIGDKDVYDILQKGWVRDEQGKDTPVPRLDISVLAADEKKLPWGSVYGKPTAWKNAEGEEKTGYYNKGAFVLFLEGIHAGAELAEDSPLRKLVSSLPLPPIAQKLKQQKIGAASTVSAPAPAKAEPVKANGATVMVAPAGSRLMNAMPGKK